MLVHRWDVLRRPMTCNMPLQKTTALTHCLCKFHNHGIDENGLAHYEQTKIDCFYSSVTRHIPLVNDSDVKSTPVKTLDRGNHSDDYD